MKRNTLATIALLAALGSYSALGGSITMDFEGLQNQEQILNYYNGGTGGLGSGPGANYGVVWGPDSLALNSGNYGNNPSQPGIAFFLSGPGDVMNVAAGFDTGFSFFYAANIAGSVDVYSGLNGTGTLLASLTLPVTANPYYVWNPVGVSFSGTAHSAVFGGSANYIGFDNITLGSETPGGVPDGGASALLLSMGVLGLGGLRRIRK